MIEQSKAWGYTTEILVTPSFELHKIFVERGGYCSIHEHMGKNNSFYILSGVLQITEWINEEKVHKLLRANDLYTCDKGVRHQFKAISQVDALEIYHSRIDPKDIIRYSKGGIECLGLS
jgi:mannose-6-phosphate isomerase-like protein (cupin superfamily)